MNKKFLLLAATISLVMAAGCSAQPVDTQTTQASRTDAETTPAYANSTYSLSLTFPKNWGGVVESKGDNIGEEINVTKSWRVFSGDVQAIPNRVKLFDSIRLVSKNDSQRFIQIQVVKYEDTGLAKSAAGNDGYGFYYIASEFQGDGEGIGMSAEDLKIQTEISEIVKSFSFKTTGTDITAWQTYTNSKFGYEIQYPRDHTVYTEIDAKNTKLIPAGVESPAINIAEKRLIFFVVSQQLWT